MARMIVRSILLFLLWLVEAPASSPADVWNVIGIDPKGDVSTASAADAAQLCYRYDKAGDMLWFRISLFSKPSTGSLGIKVTLDNRQIAAWTGRTGSLPNRAQIAVQDDAIVAGFPRTEFTDQVSFTVAAAVGSNDEWTDEVSYIRPSTIDLSAPRPSRGLREIDLGRNNLRFTDGEKTLPDSEPPQIRRSGRGKRTLILIPGVYSGDRAFEGFMARNAAQHSFRLVTPPGLGGTPPRPLPAETVSSGEFTWTRRLARDIVELIGRERLDKPIVVVQGFPGSLAAEEIAVRSPQSIGGIIEIANMPVQFAPSFRNPGREAPPDERIAIVDANWVQQWFKYVTPETWESNNYQAEMLANDADRAERARRQLEAAPLRVKIRYLVEYMASDHREAINALTVPLLALIPGFNETVLANPSYAFFKTSLQDSWEALRGNRHVQVVRIPDARALILDDQPVLADRAIAAFVDAAAHR